MNAREWIQGVYQEHGTLTPQLLVDEARPEEHPHHHQFEWDDAVAGEAHRRAQAAELIRRLKVTYGKDRSGNDKSVREWVSVDRDDGAGPIYQPTAEAVQDDFLYQLILRQAKREANTFRAKYGHLKEYGDIIRGMEAAS